MGKEILSNGSDSSNNREEKDEHTEDLVFDKESNSMITKEAYEKKVKEKLADPFGDPAKG